MQHSQMQWSTLWTVTTAATQTNERVVGITGANPIQINQYMDSVVFGIRVTAKLNLPLVKVTIFGAGNANGFPPAAAPPAPEALAETVTDIALNQGIVRAARLRSRDAAAAAETNVFFTHIKPLLPQFLLLEYSTGAPGATPTITFVVEICALGPVPQGNE